MRLESPHINSQSFPTSADVRSAFAAIEQAEQDLFVSLEDISDFASGYVQALRLEGGYCVEMRHGGTDRHYRTTSLLSQDETIAVFLTFLDTGIAVLNHWQWEDVTEGVSREIAGSRLDEKPDRAEAEEASGD